MKIPGGLYCRVLFALPIPQTCSDYSAKYHNLCVKYITLLPSNSGMSEHEYSLALTIPQSSLKFEQRHTASSIMLRNVWACKPACSDYSAKYFDLCKNI